MATTISVNKKTIKEFLENGQKQKFLIPEYQRSYSWEFDQINTLFDDLCEFTKNKIKDKSQENYFLGTVVYFINKNNEQEIIDGQQRITSILLLLRVIYEKLSHSEIQSEKGENFIKMIEPLIWKKDELSGRAYKDIILINSEVIADKQNQAFHEILKTGKTQENTRDNYNKNYKAFAKLYDKFLADNSDPDAIYNFINNLLNYTIILPIEADTQDTALTIFSTLNDRGMPLSDADIFKAKIYGDLCDNKKDEFIRKWQDLENQAREIDEKMQNLFYMYMFYLRAKDNDKETTTPKLRTYLLDKKFSSRLKNEYLLENLEQILNLMKFSNNLKEIENESWSKNLQIKQVFSLLKLTNNEWWKYPTIIYYLKHKNNANFESSYLKFLRKLFVSIFQRYSIEHAINSLKFPILKLNIEILNSPTPKFDFKEISIDDERELDRRIKEPHGNLRYSLVLFLAYAHENQNELLPANWELEHIFPQKWQSTYIEQTLNWTDEKLKELLWNIGNLIPLEKKLNIQASNGYFDKKKEQYIKSKIISVNELAKNYDDWKPENIIEQNSKLCEFIKYKFTEWLQ